MKKQKQESQSGVYPARPRVGITKVKKLCWTGLPCTVHGSTI
jgi:hypothetical protein